MDLDGFFHFFYVVLSSTIFWYRFPQVVVTVKEHESVITWDFDVIKGDVVFTVFRHKRPKEACSGSLTSLGETPSCGVIANVDALVVEKPRHCHDGESVQVCGVNRG